MVNYKKNVAFTGIALILSLAFSGCYFFPKETEVIAPPVVKPVKVTFDVMEATKSDIKVEVNCSGNFVYIVQQDLSFQDRGGRLKALNIQLGDEVKKGQVLAELDTDSLKDDIEQQKIALQKSQTTYDSIVSSGKNDISLAELNLKGLTDQYDQMTSVSKNSDNIATNDIYSQKDIDDMKKQIEVQQLNLDKLQEQYGKGGYAIEQADQDIKMQALKLKELQTEFNKSVLVSPYSGVITDIDPGIDVGSDVIMNKKFITIADKSKLQIKYVGDDVANFALGKIVKVSVNGVDYDGKVVVTPENMPFKDTTTGGDSNYIQIDVKNLPADVSAGDQADINAVLQEKKDVIVIPKNVVHTFGGQLLVYVLENGLKKERNIETGIETDTEYEVVKGLQVGDKIIK